MTAREQRAIKHFCDKGYLPHAINVHPQYTFTNTLTGLEKTVDINELVAQYDTDRRSSARERAEARKRGQV